MMKLINVLFVSAGILLSLASTAQTTENFNSRPGITTAEVKGYLQDNCWSFPDFNVPRNGWIPGIEGDGAMVSGASSSATQSTGIYTPILKVPGNISISFKYKFNNNFGDGIRRWLKIYLVNYDNEIQSELDSIEFTGTSSATVYSYNKSFGTGPGFYKIYLNYQGIGGSTRIGIDELKISASLMYKKGCNEAPVAVNDHLNGNRNRTASGFIAANDYDPNGDLFDCYVIINSPHGTVTMQDNKSFSFAPNAGFTGNSTSFTYQICDNGFGPLCSNTATVNISFPSGSSLPVSLVEFSGLYKNDGNVELNWVTTFEQNSDKFELERSLTGNNWVTAGVVKAQGVSTVKKSYRFTDNVGRNTANKKDLYYRLKTADLDGKTSLSRILVVRVYNSRSTKMISVSPNPARNDIAATIQLNEPSVVVLKIVNNSGSEIMRKTVKLSAGANSLMMEGTNKLSPGMYVMEVIVNSSERMLVKLIKE